MANPQVFNTLGASTKEATYGATPSSTIIYHWVTEPNFQPRALRHIADEGFRGVAGQMFDLIPGPGEGTVGFGGMVYMDAFPHILQNVFGTDSYPTSHRLTAAATPPSYEYSFGNMVQSYKFQGTRLSNIRMSFNAADGALTYSAQGTSKLGVTAGTAGAVYPTATYPSTPVQATAGWQGTLELDDVVAGTASASVLEGELTFSRQLTPIHSLSGVQDLSQLYAGPLQVEGRLTLDWYSDAIYNRFTGGDSGPGATKGKVVITFVSRDSAGTTSTMLISIQKAAFRQVDIERSGAIYTQVANVTGLYNSADLGPCSVTFSGGTTPWASTY